MSRNNSVIVRCVSEIAFSISSQNEITTELVGKYHCTGDKVPYISKYLDLTLNLLIFIGYVGGYIRPPDTGCSSSFCI